MYLLIFIQTAPPSLCQGQWDSFEDAHSTTLPLYYRDPRISSKTDLIWSVYTFCVNYPPIVSAPGQAINCVNHSSIRTEFTPQNEKMGFLSPQTDAIDVITVRFIWTVLFCAQSAARNSASVPFSSRGRARRLINVTGGAGARPVFIFMQILNYLIRSVTRLPFLHSPAGRAGPGPTGSSRGDPSLHNLNIYWLQSFREKIPHHRGRPSIFHTKYFHVYNIPTSESGWKQMTPCNDSSNRKLSSRCCGGMFSMVTF